jgi:hypothetical protein
MFQFILTFQGSKSGQSLKFQEQTELDAQAQKELAEMLASQQAQAVKLEGLLSLIDEALVNQKLDQHVARPIYQRPENLADVAQMVLAEIGRIEGELENKCGKSLDELLQ